MRRCSVQLLVLSLFIFSSQALAAPDPKEFAEAIRKSIPNYDSLAPMQRADAIRQWAYNNIDTAATSDCLISEQTHPLHLSSAAENFQRVFDDQGGYWCSGTAFLAAQAFRAMGFDSLTYSCGQPGKETHVTTLVLIDGKYYIEDAYFNFAFTDASGTPMPFDDVLQRLGHGKEVQLLHGPESEKDVHTDAPADRLSKSNTWTLGLTGPKELKAQIAPNHFVYRATPSIESFERFERELNPGAFTWLKQEGWPENLEFLLLYPMAVNDKGAYYPVGSDHAELKHIQAVISTACSPERHRGAVANLQTP